MKTQKKQNELEFEEYKMDLLKISNKYLIESIEIKKHLLVPKVKIMNRDIRPSK